ncbi:MAG: flagellar assembly protein FliW [Verrucomicrobiota bacterium]
MNSVSTFETETIAAPVVTEVRIPAGLLGFERIKDYLLVANPAEEPFRWLQVKNDAALAFVVIDPFLVQPEYQPDIPQTDVEFLGLTDSRDALLFNIVTVYSPTRATVNLKGPIVFNRRTMIGKQVVLANANTYSVQHPLSLGA